MSSFSTPLQVLLVGLPRHLLPKPNVHEPTTCLSHPTFQHYQAQQIFNRPSEGAGSTQMQTRSYHIRQSGNLAKKETLIPILVQFSFITIVELWIVSKQDTHYKFIMGRIIRVLLYIILKLYNLNLHGKIMNSLMFATILEVRSGIKFQVCNCNDIQSISLNQNPVNQNFRK